MASKYLSWYWIFALIFAVVLWNCFANINVKSIFFLGKTKINHLYSDSDFQQWVLYCHWLFIYSIPIGLDAKKGKRVKDTRCSSTTQITLWSLRIYRFEIKCNHQKLFIICELKCKNNFTTVTAKDWLSLSETKSQIQRNYRFFKIVFCLKRTLPKEPELFKEEF